MKYQPTTQIVHDLPNDDYRSAPGDSATFLKGCLRSVKHAMTSKKRTKALDEGLKIHEFVLERDEFLSNYKQGLNPSDYPKALSTATELKAVIAELNVARKAKIKTTGTKPQLLKRIAEDDPEHLKNVQDIGSLSASDLLDKIEFINAQPNRGLLSTSGTIVELAEQAVSAGWIGQCWQVLCRDHNATDERETLPYDEYAKYEGMYASLIEHLQAGAKQEQERGEGEVIMQWLLWAFTRPGALETEVSMFGENDKCRMDAMFNANGQWFAMDVKKTVDASDEGFSKQAARYHYDLQADHYQTVSAEVGRPVVTFAFIAIEPEAPFACNVLLPDGDFMELGARKREYAKKQLTVARESGVMTAYEPKAKSLTSPAWAGYGPWSSE